MPCPFQRDYRGIYYRLVKEFAVSHAETIGMRVVGPLAYEMYCEPGMEQLRADIEAVSEFLRAVRIKRRYKEAFEKRLRLINDELEKQAPIPQKLARLQAQNDDEHRAVQRAHAEICRVAREHSQLLLDALPEHTRSICSLLERDE